MTHTILMLLVTLFLLPQPLFAGSLVDRLEGVYKHRFKNGLVSGEKFESENVLEIVKVADNAAYLRYDLIFFNGHTCGIYGVAEAKGDKLVYTDNSTKNPQSACVLELAVKDGKLMTKDLSPTDLGEMHGCNYYCGARGGFDNISFKINSRRKIRYMKRLEASEEFKEANALYQEKIKPKNESSIEKQTEQKQ